MTFYYKGDVITKNLARQKLKEIKNDRAKNVYKTEAEKKEIEFFIPIFSCILLGYKQEIKRWINKQDWIPESGLYVPDFNKQL